MLFPSDDPRIDIFHEIQRLKLNSANFKYNEISKPKKQKKGSK